MASILSGHSTGNTIQSERYRSKFVRRYRALISLLREAFARQSSAGKQTMLRMKGNNSMFQDSGKTEEETLVEQKFSHEEIARLLKLRDHYQNGGSDRAFMMRYLNFLRYLRTRDQIHS